MSASWGKGKVGLLQNMRSSQKLDGDLNSKSIVRESGHYNKARSQSLIYLRHTHFLNLCWNSCRVYAQVYAGFQQSAYAGALIFSKKIYPLTAENNTIPQYIDRYGIRTSSLHR